MAILFALLFVLGGLGSSLGLQQDYKADFERVESINGTRQTIVDFSKLRVIRNKNREYCLNGTFQQTEDLDEIFMVEVESSYSPTGNSGYIKLPYAVPRDPPCKYLRIYFKKYGYPTFKGHTDFPLTLPEGSCVIPKGKWYVACAIPNTENYPAHGPRGLLRIDAKFYKGNEFVGGIRMFFRITDNLRSSK